MNIVQKICGNEKANTDSSSALSALVAVMKTIFVFSSILEITDLIVD